MQVKRAIQNYWKKLLMIIALLLVASFHSSCSTEGSLALSRPPCTWKLWAGNPTRGGITRSDFASPVFCNQSEFSDFVCLTSDDFKNMLTCGGK